MDSDESARVLFIFQRGWLLDIYYAGTRWLLDSFFTAPPW